MDELKTGRSDAQASKAFNVSRGYVAEAKAIKAKSPDTFEAVKRGEKTLPQARHEEGTDKRPVSD